MTSKEPTVMEDRRRSALNQLPPPANSSKPLTPFSIEDILNKPSVKRSYSSCGTAHMLSCSEKLSSSGHSLCSRALFTQTSPLCALEELASKTFKGLEVSVLQAAEGTSEQSSLYLSYVVIRYRLCSLGWFSLRSTNATNEIDHVRSLCVCACSGSVHTHISFGIWVFN